MATYRYGDWSKAERILSGLFDRTNRNMEQAAKRNAVDLRDEMKRTIAKTDPQWPPLKEATIERKGSSKILVDHADLMHGIIYQIVNSFLVFVGVKKGARNRTGEDLVQIGAVHEFGSKKRNIPMRSYIRKTLIRIRERLQKRFIKAARDALFGVDYHG